MESQDRKEPATPVPGAMHGEGGTPVCGGEKHLRALALDDDPAIAGLIAEVLRTAGWTVEAFADPAMAVRRLEEAEFDLVISDLAMTDVSGLEVLDAAKRRSPFVKVILFSGFGTIDLAVRAMKRGADDFISKPFTVRQIREKVAALFEPAVARADGTGIAAMHQAACPTSGVRPAGRSLREVERAAIVEALERNSWNIAAAARDLGISRSALYDKIARHGIQRLGGGWARSSEYKK